MLIIIVSAFPVRYNLFVIFFSDDKQSCIYKGFSYDMEIQQGKALRVKINRIPMLYII